MSIKTPEMFNGVPKKGVYFSQYTNHEGKSKNKHNSTGYFQITHLHTHTPCPLFFVGFLKQKLCFHLMTYTIKDV
jgi:hypothetical protein